MNPLPTNVTQVGPTSPTNLMDRLAALEAHNVAQDARLAAIEARVGATEVVANAARTKALNRREDHPSE